MRLEDEIKQPIFQSESQKAFLNVLFTAGWLSARQAAVFRPHGLTLPQYNVLRILRGQHPNPATVALLTERMLDRSSNASRLVDKLEQKGLVSRCVCPDDRRAVDIRITPAGLALLATIEQASRREPRPPDLSHLSDQELRQLNALLDKLRG